MLSQITTLQILTATNVTPSPGVKHMNALVAQIDDNDLTYNKNKKKWIPKKRRSKKSAGEKSKAKTDSYTQNDSAKNTGQVESVVSVQDQEKASEQHKREVSVQENDPEKDV